MTCIFSFSSVTLSRLSSVCYRCSLTLTWVSNSSISCLFWASSSCLCLSKASLSDFRACTILLCSSRIFSRETISRFRRESSYSAALYTSRSMNCCSSLSFWSLLASMLHWNRFSLFRVIWSLIWAWRESSCLRALSSSSFTDAISWWTHLSWLSLREQSPSLVSTVVLS